MKSVALDRLPPTLVPLEPPPPAPADHGDFGVQLARATQPPNAPLGNSPSDDSDDPGESRDDNASPGEPSSAQQGKSSEGAQPAGNVPETTPEEKKLVEAVATAAPIKVDQDVAFVAEVVAAPAETASCPDCHRDPSAENAPTQQDLPARSAGAELTGAAATNPFSGQRPGGEPPSALEQPQPTSGARPRSGTTVRHDPRESGNRRTTDVEAPAHDAVSEAAEPKPDVEHKLARLAAAEEGSRTAARPTTRAASNAAAAKPDAVSRQFDQPGASAAEPADEGGSRPRSAGRSAARPAIADLAPPTPPVAPRQPSPLTQLVSPPVEETTELAMQDEPADASSAPSGEAKSAAAEGAKEAPQPHTAAPRGTATATPEPTAELLGGRLPHGSDGGQASIDRVRFVQRVSRAFAAAQERGTPLRLRLSPPTLGSLKLEVSLRDGALSARLETETDAARKLLLENLPQLRERLAEQSIRIETFDVELMDERRGGQSGAAPDDRQRWAPPAARADSLRPSAAPADEPQPLARAGRLAEGQLNVIV